jgi:hypothetical protein
MRDHAVKLLAKHHIQSVGFWLPVTNSESQLVFLLAYPSREARETSWKALADDPEWQAVRRITEADGPLVTRTENVFLEPTDYSPKPRTGAVSGGGVFELRTYTTPTGRLPALDARFRDHTLKLFVRHGIKNWGLFPRDAGPTRRRHHAALLHRACVAESCADLVQCLPHGSRLAGAARTASEAAAGGSLTVPGGVKSVFLRATNYSPTK